MPAPPPPDRLVLAARGSALAVLAGAVAWAAWLSLGWRMTLDAPYMMFLPQQWLAWGLVPYRDVFEHNAPGGFLASGLAYALVGADDRGLRWVDLTWLAATMAAIGWALRRFGWGPAVAAPLLFAGFYLNQGPMVAYQREFQMVLPLALALASSPPQGGGDMLRAAGAGLGCGAAAAIKPPALLAAPFFALWWWRAAGLKALAAFGAGLAVPLLALLAALAWLGGLAAYLDVTTGYYPLYNDLSGEGTVLTGPDRWTYRLQGAWHHLGGQKRWLAFALLGLAWGAWAGRERRAAVVAIALAVPLGVLYATALGKFFDYHWLPFHLACALAGALLLADPPAPRRLPALAATALFGLAAWLTFRASPDVYWQWRGQPIAQPELVRVDAMAAALKARVTPGERVQILEWTNGGTHAALLAGVRTATPFYQDFVFYHHVSAPYIVALRQRFLAGLDADPPRWVLRVPILPGPCDGPDTEPRFEGLETRLAAGWRQVAGDDAWQLLERVSTPAGAP